VLGLGGVGEHKRFRSNVEGKNLTLNNTIIHNSNINDSMNHGSNNIVRLTPQMKLEKSFDTRRMSARLELIS